MKKSSYHYYIDTTLYYLLAIAPLIVLVALCIHGGTSAISDFFATCNGIFEGTALYTSINDSIGVNGTASLFNVQTNVIVDYICYVVYITVIHLIIDCVQFIPEFAHRFLECVGGKSFE